MAGKEATNPFQLYDLTFGLVKTEVLFAAVNLGVFDAVAEKPLGSQKVAEQLKIPDTHLDKLLNTCAMLGLLVKDHVEDEEYVFRNSALSAKYLTTKDNKESLVDFVKMNQMFKNLSGRLQAAVETGKQQITDKDNLFYLFEQKPENRQIFQNAMACISRTSHYLIDAFDLSEFKTHVDVGGGTGTFARALADAYPKMDVHVCDLERVINTALDLPVNKNTRVKFVPGDFFKGDLPPADLYSMCHVLHDWNDEECDKILPNVFKAVKPGGALLVLDTVFNDDKVGPFRANMTEISQIVQHDGKHRTGAEFTRMLTKHGFTDIKIHRFHGFGFYDGLLARKPQKATPSED